MLYTPAITLSRETLAILPSPGSPVLLPSRCCLLPFVRFTDTVRAQGMRHAYTEHHLASRLMSEANAETMNQGEPSWPLLGTRTFIVLLRNDTFSLIKGSLPNLAIF